ncbi:3'-5' exonuclease [Acinetobacter chinensis]|uniref:3'-5' exonuclease n=1 Tax=Acinetobacter chinensis TaxID=2004650 RepID=UPI003741F8D8
MSQPHFEAASNALVAIYLVNTLELFSDDPTFRLLTIHKIKGLEFNSLILLSIKDQKF